MTNHHKSLPLLCRTSGLIVLLLVSAVFPQISAAFDTGIYAESSRLASGRWVKISVDRSGLFLLPVTTLRSWGFDDLSAVRVHGYGGRRIGDVLDAASYVDDLPAVPVAVTARGVVFYAQGPGEWAETQRGRFRWVMNDYTSAAYYFVTAVENSDESPAPSLGRTGDAVRVDEAATTFFDRRHHEIESVSPGEAGALLVGEDFRYTTSHSVRFDVEDIASGGEAWIESSFIADCSTSSSTLSFTCNNQPIAANTSDRIQAIGSASYTHASESVARHDFSIARTEASVLDIGINMRQSGFVLKAWLNYLALNYERELRLPASGYLEFWSDAPALALGGVQDAAGLILWDVTDPSLPLVVDNILSGGAACWSSGRRTWRSYVACKDGATLPQPRFESFVDSQNLHADESVDMVIFSPADYMRHAENIAEIHRNSADSLRVRVLDVTDVYNEFSSGAADVSGLRRYLKMLYDRGQAGVGRPLRYVLLLARMTFDNRHLTALRKSEAYPTIPAWMPRAVTASLSDNTGYCTDDFIAMLEDGAGADMGLDRLSVAVGRIPVVSADEARSIVEKIKEYAAGARRSSWKNRLMFLADDGDDAIHVRQTERMLRGLDATEGNQHLVRKVYMDAYEKSGGKYPEARSLMFRYLDEGVMWWNFVGHANTTGWTGEGQLSYTDLNNMYLRHWPFIYAATCDFLRMDASDISGAEILFKERYGGAIGVISATRPVYISDNGLLSSAIGRAIGLRGDDGRFFAPGEIYRRAKNDIRSEDGVRRSNLNRLRYVFMGDPALRLAIPDNVVRLDSIGDIEVNADNQPTLAALQQTVIRGSVLSPAGELLSDFEGVVTVDILDAEKSLTTKGNNDTPKEVFEDYGDRVFTGSARVSGGRFTLDVAMPAEISQNFRPATMSMYAYSTAVNDEAVGLCSDFYVYGFDEAAIPDTSAPVIESFVLNHESFTSGDAVNSTPMLIAAISDDTGLNVSTAGIGHQMTAQLDGKRTFSDLTYYFTPSADGTPSGVINYPMEELTDGNHTITLRVWDTSGNSASKTIDFFVDSARTPKIFDIYSDANPASTVANFYLSHDQPDRMVTVELTVYNLMGKPLWSRRQSGRSDMFLTVPVSWDLTDGAGRRVQRGIYLYRATITADGEHFDTGSRRIAVTAAP